MHPGAIEAPSRFRIVKTTISDNHAYVSRFLLGTPTKRCTRRGFPLSLLWTANTLETVSGFEAVALLVVPIELVGLFLARNLVGAIAKRLGVR